MIFEIDIAPQQTEMILEILYLYDVEIERSLNSPPLRFKRIANITNRAHSPSVTNLLHVKSILTRVRARENSEITAYHD